MAIKTPRTLPPRLQAVMVRLCKDAKLNKTQAVKLPYLVDVIATHVLGQPITEGSHEGWDLGVVTSQAWHYLNKCDQESSSFEVEPVPYSEEQRIRVAEEVKETGLTPAQQAVVDFVKEQFGRLSATELGTLTKVMNPGIKVWGSNKPADIGRDAFERMSAEYQEMARKAASITLKDLRKRSSKMTRLEDAIA